ncbi:unnamed protein product [Meloidogyne enterolobii]|uniref:Uncharacterized protein n=1 Tax=Meloidogyne enterolobii TaxID=390850 RepID=A0ACB0YRM8_MELEN
MQTSTRTRISTAQAIYFMPGGSSTESEGGRLHPQKLSKVEQQKTLKAKKQPTTPTVNSTTLIHVTPRRSTPKQRIRREHSASITIPPRSALSATDFSLRYTPPAVITEGIKFWLMRGLSSTVFAGSKFTDSPSAKSLPLPPSQWLSPSAFNENKMAANNVKDDNLTKTPTKFFVPTTEGDRNGGSGGIRMHPLHLIAATTMSS